MNTSDGGVLERNIPWCWAQRSCWKSIQIGIRIDIEKNVRRNIASNRDAKALSAHAMCGCVRPMHLSIIFQTRFLCKLCLTIMEMMTRLLQFPARGKISLFHECHSLFEKRTIDWMICIDNVEISSFRFKTWVNCGSGTDAEAHWINWSLIHKTEKNARTSDWRSNMKILSNYWISTSHWLNI